MMASFIDKVESLTPDVRRIVCDKATEFPHSGTYNAPQKEGTYLCRRCGLGLFRAATQFKSGCGWPSFDKDIKDAVKQKPDDDDIRTEILCNRCHAHLGHIFYGEQFTATNIRHCVNSAALDFVENNKVTDSEEAIVAGGCFWGVEYYLQKLTGVLKTESGYTGGHVQNPDYQQVCQGDTAHYEAVRVLYDPELTDYQSVIKRFFEIHDPTQKSGQGPDKGPQYQSAIFCFNDKQQAQAESLIKKLKAKGFDITTKIFAVQPFWPAEASHQNYYAKQQKSPYCHKPVSRFD